MRRISEASLGIMVAVLASAALATAGAQAGGGPNACAIFDAQELMSLSGLRDVLGRGPQLADPAEVPKGRSECEFLGITFGLDASMTRDWFARTRADQVKSGTKLEPIPGLGDEAYYWWDPQPGSYRQVGIAVRTGSYRLTLLDLTESDSIPAAKATLLKIARYVTPRVR